MKRTLLLLSVVLVLGLLLSGCKKEQKAAEPTEPTTEEPKEDPAKPAVDEKKEPKAEEKTDEKTEEKTDEKTDEKTEAVAGSDAERDCGALHDMMHKMIEAMKAKLGKGAQPKKEFPPKDKFVAACKELPAPVVRCMNPRVAMKEGAKCQKVMMNADKTKIAKFKSMLK